MIFLFILLGLSGDTISDGSSVFATVWTGKVNVFFWAYNLGPVNWEDEGTVLLGFLSSKLQFKWNIQDKVVALNITLNPWKMLKDQKLVANQECHEVRAWPSRGNKLSLYPVNPIKSNLLRGLRPVILTRLNMPCVEVPFQGWKAASSKLPDNWLLVSVILSTPLQ